MFALFRVVPLGVVFLLLLLSAAPVRAGGGETSCEDTCTEYAIDLVRECHEQGGGMEDCMQRGQYARMVCTLEQCEPGETCEQGCSLRGRAFFIRCVAAGHPTGDCRERATAVELECVERECAPCLCPLLYDPVCGADGTTYANHCEAGCADTPVEHEGICSGGDCPCSDVWSPVCGVDGTTYANACETQCAGVRVAHQGICDDASVCICPEIWDPVCGSDGATYSNTCRAQCGEVDVAHDGECRPSVCDPTCTTNADCGGNEICHPESNECKPRCVVECLLPIPVCGTDGATYRCGATAAACNGADVAYDGECRDPWEWITR